MTAHTKGSGMTWVWRAIRRVEDPALVTGQGRFTADLPAVHWVRFLRSPAAAGKIERIKTPDGATVITATDLTGVKPILPMLHKFEYKPLAQPILADGEVRFVGEPVEPPHGEGIQEGLTIDEVAPRRSVAHPGPPRKLAQRDPVNAALPEHRLAVLEQRLSQVPVVERLRRHILTLARI